MKLDFNQCRGIVRALKSMTSADTIENLSQAAAMQPTELVQWLESTTETIDFGENRDLVDMEVSHYSALGKFNSNGVLMPTLCFTSDNKHQTRTRASVINASIQFILGSFRQMQSESPPESFQLIEPKQGAIAYVSSHGDVTNVERIIDIPDPLNI